MLLVIFGGMTDALIPLFAIGALLPIRRCDALAVKALNFAFGLARDVLHSAYRELLEPLLAYLKQLALAEPDRPVVVIIRELVERRWYQYFLHGQTASLLKTLLLLRGMPQLVVVTTPWYLTDWLPERNRLFRRRNRSRKPAN